MNKRLEKRHKRQVARAREQVKVSEPDVRTPEQIKAAREASRPQAGSRDFNSPRSPVSSARSGGRGVDSAAKTDA